METKKLCDYTKKELSMCSDSELLNAAFALVKDACKDKGFNSGKKKLYFISAEFLIGKLLSNNLINLGLYDEIKAELEEAGKSITFLEELEYEPSLGNGGLGRLAACFLDSLATLGLPADGLSITYHCGLFRQIFQNNVQTETPDYWMKWGVPNWMRRTDKKYRVKLREYELISTMYEIDVPGYGSKCGRLRLFDVDSVDERAISSGISFEKEEVDKALTLFLYPDDSDEHGKMLRVCQEYFMVSNAAQLIIDECVERGSNLHDLAEYAAVQINDTHPALVVPELVRLLTEKGIEENEACRIVTDVCAYTNHTIMAEALEKWPEQYLKTVAPDLMPIIERMDKAVKSKYKDPSVHIIVNENGKSKVHMAHLIIHFCHSVNGVAKLHTEILKNTELNNFYQIYPERFNSKTNGITFRRWIINCNPRLTELINDAIGATWMSNAAELENLLPLAEDPDFRQRILDSKAKAKRDFAEWLKKHQDINVDPESVYDVQIKRLHEYKRQQMNLLWAIDQYLQIKKGRKPSRPVTVFFGGKAAPAYKTAKNIIHAILAFSSLVDGDPDINPCLKVVMLRNYNVSVAEKMIPAADISEQISLASKEASGTGNMKLMLNGAVTLGTMDGANVEIAELVGEDNIFTFGQSSKKVIEHYQQRDYKAAEYYEEDPRIKEAVDFLISEEMVQNGDKKLLQKLHDELVNKDYFMTFLDFESYCKAKDVALKRYEDRTSWARMMIYNIAKAGYFSSDRTIEQYNDEIWHLKKDGY